MYFLLVQLPCDILTVLICIYLGDFIDLSYLSCFLVILKADTSLWWLFFTLQIDSVMSTRLANENDSSRRLKSEFLIQFDGVSSNPDDLVIVLG
jgi:hypothetical protein